MTTEPRSVLRSPLVAVDGDFVDHSPSSPFGFSYVANGSDSDFDATLRLVRAAQDGDAGALDDLFRRYLPRVRQIVALRVGRRLRQMMDVEDLVQNSLLRVLSSLKDFEARSEARFRNWLATCVEREIVDSLRTETRQKRGGGAVLRFGDCDASVLRSSLFGRGVSTPSAHACAEELAARLEEEILAMPVHERELIILRAVCDMSYEEMGAQLGLTNLDVLRVACSRAFRKLRARIE